MKVNTGAPSANTLPGAAANGPKEAVGDVANRIANSGKANGRRVQGQGNAQLDKDAFFKLMLAQVKNQDPTNPLKNHEMAAQLAQFSSLEQMSNVNETLKQMQKGQGQDSQFQALNLIGKVVKADNSKIQRAQGDASHDLSFHLKDNAAQVNVSVIAPDGKTVRTFQLQNVAQGTGRVQWDGKDQEGVAQPAGSYKISVDAKNAGGQRVATDTEFGGKVTGVQFSEAGPIVSIGKLSLPLKDIKFIEGESGPAREVPQASAPMMNMPGQKMFDSASPIPSGLPMEAAQLASLNSKLNSLKE